VADSHVHEPRSRIWAKRALGGLVVVGFLILAGFLGAAFIPRWWAHRVGNQVNGSIATGIIVGLFYGFLFTAVPFLVLSWTFRKRRPMKGWTIGFLVAVMLALPNLFTLGIVLGSGHAAHAGDRTLDVEAPGFRGGCLAGAIVAVVAFALWEYIRISGKLHHRRLRKMEARLKQQEAELDAAHEAAKHAAEAPPPPPPPAPAEAGGQPAEPVEEPKPSG
jgi:MFS family permease